MTSLEEKYKKEIKVDIQKLLGIKNPMATPGLVKITLNIGLKEAISDKKVIEKAVEQLGVIAGQKPIVTKAKKAIAGFKLRIGDPVGVTVTLRGKRMYHFFEKLVNIVLPRVRDFRGVNLSAFDGQGNYSLGFSEQIVFPEIEYDRIDKLRGLQVNITTSARNNEEGRMLLTKLGMPFKKS